MCSNDDLKELGVPMGPRKKLTSLISEWAIKKEEQAVCSYNSLYMLLCVIVLEKKSFASRTEGCSGKTGTVDKGTGSTGVKRWYTRNQICEKHCWYWPTTCAVPQVKF